MDVSVIIPCFNEEIMIGRTIQSVMSELVTTRMAFEILVVDNGSSDASRSIALKCGAKIIESPAKTVAGVRNQGASHASGTVLVFLDADVVVGKGWGEYFRQAWATVGQRRVGGAHCSVPEGVPWLLAAWFTGIENDDRGTHLGTGHLIIPAKIFEEIGGFDESLATGEDFEFCQRAKRLGVSILPDRHLRAFHCGYPRTLWMFFRREVWHGVGDCKDWSTFVRSKTAIASVFFVGLLLSICLFAFLSFPIFCLLLLIIIAFLGGVVFYKFGFVSLDLYLLRLAVCGFYLAGRAISPLICIFGKI